MNITLIVAVARNGVMGRDGGLPWRLPADLARFRRLTMGHHLLVGRLTWDSIGKPLPGRSMIVLTRSELDLPEGVAALPSIDAAIELAREAGETELFVAGGAQVYALTLPLAGTIHWTAVDADVEGDVVFPEWDRDDWELVSREEGVVDERNALPHTFLEYRRRSPEEVSPA